LYRDEPWAPARGSFGTPVLPPTVDPDASPTKAFTISCQWLPFIRGALLQLVLQATWKTDDPAVRLLAQQRAMLLIAMFDECTSLQVPFACEGDVRLNQNPYGTFGVGAEGQWVMGSGYGSTCCTLNISNHHYAALILHINFTNPVTISNVHLEYDYAQGENGDPSDYGLDVYDNGGGSGLIGSPITMASMVSVSGQSYDSGSHSTPISSLGINLISAIGISHDPVIQGLALLKRINISGSSTNPPC